MDCLEDMRNSLADGNPLLERALDLERRYDWQGAAEAYDNVLRSASEDDSPTLGDIIERKAYALHRAAFQADTNEQFARQMEYATDEYEAARKAYSESSDRIAPYLALRCGAMISLSLYHKATEGRDKKKAVEDSWALARKALEGFEKAGESRQFCVTCAVLNNAGALTFSYATTYDDRLRNREECSRCCEKAVELLQVGGDTDLLARACIGAARQTMLSRQLSHPSKKEAMDKKALEFVRKAVETNRGSAIDTIAREFLDIGLPRSMPPEESGPLLKEVIERAKTMNDHLAIGTALEWQSALTGYDCHESTSSDQGKALADECHRLAVEAAHEYSIVSHDTPCETPVATWSTESGYHVLLAMVDPDLDAKRWHAVRGLEESERTEDIAKRSAMPDRVTNIGWERGMLLSELAKTEGGDAKKKALEQAVDYAKRFGAEQKRLYPQDRFLGGSNWILAQAERQMAEMVTDSDERRKLLEDGVFHAGESYEGLRESLFDWDMHIAHLYLGKSQYVRGELCLLLYDITHDQEDLTLASESFEKAAEMHLKGEQPSRVAESLWQAAISYSIRGDRAKSSERFSRAAEMFRQAAEDIPRLGKFYEDHALYMDAWAELEHARYHHERQEHGQARESYDRAASTLSSTKRWSVFATNYAAWAAIEKAEELSRSDSNEEAERAFQEAGTLFMRSKDSITSALKSMDQKDEIELAQRLMAAADLRRDYCSARVAIEKAKTLDRNGLEAASAEKYSEAVETLEGILGRVETIQDRKDIRLVLTLTRAWQRMTEAEAKVNPGLFGEAAVLFEEAKELSTDKGAKLLATGHSRFCRALEAGMEFSDTGEGALHAEATKHLESAAKHYLKAGFQNASEYANASKLLFDGYVHMDRASKEEDQGKKARLFTLAEKVLEASAASYERSQYPGKKEQITKLLEKIRRDRELAVSLTKALQAPDIMSATTSFSTPTATHEKAVGTERFEHADVQATIIARPVDLKVGDDFRLEIELVNAGRGCAQLTKVERVVPQGFDVIAEPENYRVEDSYLNMKGRKLDTLKTEDVKLILKPKVHGEFRLTPRIMYLDDSGKYRSCEPEPVDVTVRELGISGWLKGPESRR